MVILQSWNRIPGFVVNGRVWWKENMYYMDNTFHPCPTDHFVPLALIVGDCIPGGHNLNRQWDRAGEDFWLAVYLTQWDCNYFLKRWEPHP